MQPTLSSACRAAAQFNEPAPGNGYGVNTPVVLPGCGQKVLWYRQRRGAEAVAVQSSAEDPIKKHPRASSERVAPMTAMPGELTTMPLPATPKPMNARAKKRYSSGLRRVESELSCMLGALHSAVIYRGVAPTQAGVKILGCTWKWPYNAGHGSCWHRL